MKKFSFLNFIVACIFMMDSCFLNAAVFQAPVQQKPGAFKTEFLFYKESLPDINQLKSFNNSRNENTPIPSNTSSFLKATYVKPSVEFVQQIIKKYKSIPGGITLEGQASGLTGINSVQFNPGKNEFLINNNIIFKNVLSLLETKEILTAIQNDDLLGVSLGKKDIIYGKLEQGSISSIFMKLADHFLGSIVFACQNWIYYNNFPEGFRPKQDEESDGFYAVYFNFNSFSFKVENNQMLPADAGMEITIVPLLNEKDDFGGYVPDYKKISEGSISGSFETNIMHIVKNINYYQNDKRMQKVTAYGQLAAFARLLKQSGISLSNIL